MEFMRANYINTTTMISVGSNTATAKNIMNSDVKYQYVSDGFNDDNTTASITINFSDTTTIDRLLLDAINVKAMNIFYNGSTANTLALTTTSNTTVSQWTSNSETAMWLPFSSINVTSVTFDLKSTQEADNEKAIGRIILSTQLLNFERIPAAKDFKPKKNVIDQIHKLSDGTKKRHVIKENWECEISFKWITQTFRDNLQNVYESASSHVFVAFPTSTSWDRVYFDSIWGGTFDFHRRSDNAEEAGFSGKINLMETTP